MDKVDHSGGAGVARGNLWQRFAASPDRLAALVAYLLLFTAYLSAFLINLSQAFAESLIDAMVNANSALVMGIVFYLLLTRFVLHRPLPILIALQVPMALLFATGWYFGTLVGFSVSPGWTATGLMVKPFSKVAFTWQIFQGVSLYAALLMFTLWRRAVAELAALKAQAAEVKPARRTNAETTLLVKAEREVVPVAFTDIVSIGGADGYAEVVTRTRRILSTTSLNRFEEILPPDQFLRVHRSFIVRLGAVMNAEPAGGGKLLLHLEGGDSLTTSRAGAQRLKAQAV